MADWWTSLLSGFLGAIGGAVLTRNLTDRSNHREQLYRAYVTWVVALADYVGVHRHEHYEEYSQSLSRARWTLHLLERDDQRRDEVAKVTAAVLDGRDLPDLNERMETPMATIRREFGLISLDGG